MGNTHTTTGLEHRHDRGWDSSGRANSSPAGRGPTRPRPAGPGRAIVVTGLALGAATATWLVILGLGVDPVVAKGGGPVRVTTLDVVVATTAVGVAAWATSAVLVRQGRAHWWPILATSALSLSMVGPIYQADGAAAVALSGMHFVVGVVVIAGFTRSDGRRGHRPPRQAARPVIGPGLPDSQRGSGWRGPGVGPQSTIGRPGGLHR